MLSSYFPGISEVFHEPVRKSWTTATCLPGLLRNKMTIKQIVYRDNQHFVFLQRKNRCITYTYIILHVQATRELLNEVMVSIMNQLREVQLKERMMKEKEL